MAHSECWPDITKVRIFPPYPAAKYLRPLWGPGLPFLPEAFNLVGLACLHNLCNAHDCLRCYNSYNKSASVPDPQSETSHHPRGRSSLLIFDISNSRFAFLYDLMTISAIYPAIYTVCKQSISYLLNWNILWYGFIYSIHLCPVVDSEYWLKVHLLVIIINLCLKQDFPMYLELAFNS